MQDEINENTRNIKNVTEHIRQILKRMLGDRERLQRLSHEITNLTPMTNLVQEIGRQTNLLSLNASICSRPLIPN